MAVWARDYEQGLVLRSAGEFDLQLPSEVDNVSVAFYGYALTTPAVIESKSGYAFLTVLSNLIASFWLKDENLMQKSLAAAKKIVASKNLLTSVTL